jgi:hypothetical protein
MRNSNTCIDADETTPRVLPLTQASEAQESVEAIIVPLD